MADDLLSIDLGFNVDYQVSIHPTVGLQILDYAFRKQGRSGDTLKKTRVAGSLLGSVFTNKVHITNCYAVTIDEDVDDASVFTMDFNEHRQLFQMHIQSYPNQVLLGAFVTGDTDLDISVAYLSQEIARKENFFFSTAVLSQPIILKVDSSLTNGSLEFKAYRLNQSLKEFAGVASFNTLKTKIEFLDENYSQVVPFLERDDGAQLNNFKVIDTESPQETVDNALKNIQILQDYVQAVINGQKVGDEDLGRQLLKYLNTIDVLRSEDFLKEYTQRAQESQLLQFLSNLAQCQTVIGEKLSKI